MNSFEDYVTMKVIEMKRFLQNSCSSPEMMLDLVESSGGPVRNLCVRMHASELARVNALASVLQSSKQELVMEMISGALEQALTKLEERGLYKVWEAQWETELEAQGLALSEPDESGNRRFTVIEK